MEIRYEPSKEVSFEINSANITGIATSNHNEIISVLALENIDKVVQISQAPIGRTPRSNPATYTGVFDDIRAYFL